MYITTFLHFAFFPHKSDVQGVPTCLEQLRKGSERVQQHLRKIYFFAKKLLFTHFLFAAKYEIAFSSNLAYVVIYLVNWKNML